MGSIMLSEHGAYQLYIDGQWVGNNSGKTFPVYDPSTRRNLRPMLSKLLPSKTRY